MMIGNFCSRFAVRARLVALMLALTACAGHAPTHRAVAPSVREHVGAPRDEAEAKRDLAKNSRDALNPSEAGYYLDVLQARLVQVLGADTKLSRTPDRIGIDLAHRVSFESGNPWLSKENCRLLQPLGNALAEYGKTVVVVEVGVDGIGKEAGKSAQRRAHAVAQCLTNSGVAARRIVIRAMSSAEATHATDVTNASLELDVELILRGAGNDK